MLQFSASSNLDDIIANLTELEATQVPFAMVLGLNRTSAEAQNQVKSDLPGRFTLRRDWVAKGVRTKFATRSAPVALVYTKDWFMEHQETGATRTSSKGGAMFIPSLEVREGESISGLIKKGMRPGALLKKAEKAGAREKRRYRKGEKAYAQPLAFIATMSNGKRGLFIRRQADKRLPIVLLYTLDESVKVPPRWGFGQTTEGVADKVLRREFIKALDEGLNSAKGGPIKSNYVDHLTSFDGPQDWYSGGSASGGSVLSSLER